MSRRKSGPHNPSEEREEMSGLLGELGRQDLQGEKQDQKCLPRKSGGKRSFGGPHSRTTKTSFENRGKKNEREKGGRARDSCCNMKDHSRS